MYGASRHDIGPVEDLGSSGLSEAMPTKHLKWPWASIFSQLSPYAFKPIYLEHDPWQRGAEEAFSTYREVDAAIWEDTSYHNVRSR